MSQHSLFATEAPSEPIICTGEVHIGTSGYMFPNWRGEFYPDKLPQDKWLKYYSKFFSAVEINATYYRALPASSFEGMSKATPDNFNFWVKVPSSLTHNISNIEASINQFTASIAPLAESEKLCGVLAQFPPSFNYCSKNIKYLEHLREKFYYTDLAVEFRSSEWSNDSVYELIKDSDIIPVVVDLPEIDGLPETVLTTGKGVGYVRLHGRNNITWYNQRLGDRYDYNYTVPELEIWRDHTTLLSEMAGTTYIFLTTVMQVKL